MIKICDSIMGSGKSMSAINYMNEHPDEKFVYITPYLDEAQRIKEACTALRFIEPSNNIPEYEFSKCKHTAQLIKEGRNIATTHQAFRNYTREMLEDINRQEYMLIIDESVEFLERFDIWHDDVCMLEDAGYIERSHLEGAEGFTKTDKASNYDGYVFRRLFDFMDNRILLCIDDAKDGRAYCWALSPILVNAFKDVVVLTYLFEAQSFHHFLEMNHIPYEYIGVKKNDDGEYHFCELPGDTPEYVGDLREMIHIADKPKLNSVGDKNTALSMTWFASNADGSDRVKKNMWNYVNNIWNDIDSNKKMWGSYAGQKNDLSGSGYMKSFLAFNAKATNDYRDRDHLIYAANVFMHVGEKRFYQKNGIDVREDLYALSVMVQWIWRSAIRDGKPIWIYIPSKRMRDLLTNWIDCVSEGRDIFAEAS